MSSSILVRNDKKVLKILNAKRQDIQKRNQVKIHDKKISDTFVLITITGNDAEAISITKEEIMCMFDGIVKSKNSSPNEERVIADSTYEGYKAFYFESGVTVSKDKTLKSSDFHRLTLKYEGKISLLSKRTAREMLIKEVDIARTKEKRLLIKNSDFESSDADKTTTVDIDDQTAYDHLNKAVFGKTNLAAIVKQSFSETSHESEKDNPTTNINAQNADIDVDNSHMNTHSDLESANNIDVNAGVSSSQLHNEPVEENNNSNGPPLSNAENIAVPECTSSDQGKRGFSNVQALKNKAIKTTTNQSPENKTDKTEKNRRPNSRKSSTKKQAYTQSGAKGAEISAEKLNYPKLDPNSKDEIGKNKEDGNAKKASLPKVTPGVNNIGANKSEPVNTEAKDKSKKGVLSNLNKRVAANFDAGTTPSKSNKSSGPGKSSIPVTNKGARVQASAENIGKTFVKRTESHNKAEAKELGTDFKCSDDFLGVQGHSPMNASVPGSTKGSTTSTSPQSSARATRNAFKGSNLLLDKSSKAPGQGKNGHSKNPKGKQGYSGKKK